MRNLSALNKGERGRIAAIDGDARFLSRITSIGITRGSVVEVLQNQKKHPVLIYGRDTMIAINRSECKKIMVEVIGE